MQIDMGCRHQPEIDGDRLVDRKARDGALLQDAQQISLEVRRQVANFIENSRPPFAASILPILRSVAPVNAPFSYPEQRSA